MTFERLALNIGKSGVYFYSMRNANPDKYAYIFSKHKCKELAVIAYEKEVEEIYMYMQDLYYSMPKKEFFDLCKKHDLISNKKNCDYSFEKSLFSVADALGKPFPFVMRLKKFVEGQS